MKLHEKYPVKCPLCSHDFEVKPSLFMSYTERNSGAVSCPNCDIYLHLEIYPDFSGDRMKAVPHAEWVKAEKGKK